jgi:alpha-tubulin suppressor-like RCC1 family protein
MHPLVLRTTMLTLILTLLHPVIIVALTCDAGYYGTTVCTSCVAGTYSAMVGATAIATCTPCAAGTYSTAVGASVSSTCTACPTGSFAVFPGSTSCRKCPMNMTTLGTGSNSLADCVCKADLYMDPYGFCVECTPGSSSPVNSQTYDACTCSGTAYKGQGGADSASGVSCGMVVSTGNVHTCALFTDVGKIKCWGSNRYGQLGTGNGTILNVGNAAGGMGSNLAFVDFGANPNVVDMQAGVDTTCVLFANGKMKCFGCNNRGQLGLGDTVTRYTAAYLTDTTSTGFVDVGTGQTVVSMNLGLWYTCVVLDNNQVKCFGRNDAGQLGVGDIIHRGDNANEMGDFLPAVDFGTNRYAVRLFGSGSKSSVMCALLNTAELKCWGNNYQYVLGMGFPQYVNISGTLEAFNIGDAPGEMGDNLVAILLPTGKTVVNLWVSVYVVVIFDDHTMTAWGGGPGLVGDQLADMGDNLHIIDLGTGRKPVQAMVNWDATIVLFDNGDVTGFGSNIWGSLGSGTLCRMDPRYDIGNIASEMGNGLPLIDFGTGVKVRGLASNAFHHFCVVTHTNKVKCWGRNPYGQLGLGDVNDRGDELDEMGNNLPAVDLGYALAPCAGVGQQPACISEPLAA